MNEKKQLCPNCQTGADCYNVALAVTDNLKLNFFPAADTLFNKDLCDW